MKHAKNLDATEILELIFMYLTEATSLRKHDEILMLLAEMGRALTSADRCRVWVVSDDKRKIWTKVAHGIEPIEVDIDSGVVGTAIKDGEKIIIDDIYKDNRFNAEIEKISGYKTKSMMVIPMFDSNEKIIGAFQAINSRSEKGLFDEGDMQRLMLASRYAAETLASAKLTQEEERGNKVTVLGAFGTKAKGFGTSSFYLNQENVIDAGNLLVALEEKSAKIENIWITHSHLDHISDIAYIIDNYYASIDKTITICGLPATLHAIQKHFLNDLIWPDFSKIPLANKSGMCIGYKEIELDKEYALSQSESIRAFKTDHTVPSCGYVYKKDNSALLITADTYSLENALNIVNSDDRIKSMVLECSFPSHMETLAKESKHLTPKLLANMLEGLKREDVNLYINHIKPSFIEEIIKEIGEYCAKWKPKIVKDGEIINF